ncbi:exonuclease domain-containing protein [Psychrobacillus antarcticus]|uniref:exonuclease domain-containing protein n=1 Tax=Psychrobacillus antarcticus TaxID=2879115 RepID=UPI002407DF95|nr:exonuclease domain-containing protein [Psychrobacillus antarcticus]
MDFVAIDFETANSLRSSVCSVGIVQVKNGKIYREIQSLINPLSEFYYYNTKIHGITEYMVHGAPTFEEFWPEMKSLIENQVVIAHNASFDMGVLQESLRQFHEPSPNFEYGCSFRIAKKVWPQLYNHKLSTVANYLGISLRHHDALEDARAAAIITIEAMKKTQTNSVQQLAKLHNVKMNSSIQPKKQLPSQRRDKADLTIEFLEPERSELNSKHPFYGAQIVFTGRMLSMTRSKAAQLAVNCGAVCKGAVDHQTNYLVVGDNDLAKYLQGIKSTKMQKVEGMIQQGHPMEIVGEQDFLRLVRHSF